MDPKPSWDIRKTTLKKYPKEVATLRKLEQKLSARDRKRLQDAVKKLDRRFLEEKAELVLDTLFEIENNSKRTPNTLLQRNLWSSLDAVALHLDYTGFSKVFADVAPKLLKGARLDDPDFVRLERDAFLSVLNLNERRAGKAGRIAGEIAEVMQEADREKNGKCGWKNIQKKTFTFQEAFAKSCGRPDKILEIHHSPQKLVVAGAIGIINIIFVFVFIPLAIVSAVVLLFVACAGC